MSESSTPSAMSRSSGVNCRSASNLSLSASSGPRSASPKTSSSSVTLSVRAIFLSNYRGQVHFLADSVETNRLAIGGPVRLCKPSATTLEHPHQPTPLPGKTWNTLTRSRYNPRNRDRHPARVARFFLPAHASNWAGWSASWIVPTQSAVAVWHWGIACTSPPLRSPTRPAPR